MLLIHCLLLLPVACGSFVFGPCFVIQYLVSSFFSFAIISLRKREQSLPGIVVFPGNQLTC